MPRGKKLYGMNYKKLLFEVAYIRRLVGGYPRSRWAFLLDSLVPLSFRDALES